MKSKKTPVVFFHIGNQKFLKTAIETAEKNNDVVLIGDRSNQSYCKKWRNFESYESVRFKKFVNTYKHMSSNDKRFELSCFQRYFFLYEFMKNEQAESVIMVDSDLLVFCDLDECFKKYDCTCAFSIMQNQEPYIWEAGPQCCYWMREQLFDFIRYLEQFYSANIAKLEEKYAYMRSRKELGGISDMTALYLWSKEQGRGILNLATVRDNMVFDRSLQIESDFGMNEYCFSKILRMKKIYYIDNMPYFKKSNGDLIKAATIHCQGSCKSVMKFVNKKTNFGLLLFARYFEFAKRLKSRIRRRISLYK